MYGVVKRLERSGVKISVNVAPADINLKKTTPKVGEIIFSDGDARSYISKLHKLSPRFVDLVAEQVEHASIRKIGEWLGLHNSMDAQVVVEELRRIKNEL